MRASSDQANRDFDRILTIVLLLIILISGLDVLATLMHWILPGQWDIVLLALLIVSAGTIAFAARRWIELRKEVERRTQAEAALQKAHDELEVRVESRTADLRQVNLQLEEEVERRKTSEVSLERKTAQLSALSRKLVEAQEVERRTIAQELHDDVGQSLTGLKLILERLARQDSAVFLPDLLQAGRVAGELLTKVRELALDLRPSMLDDLGLLPALLWQIERFTSLSQVRVDFHHQGLERRFPAAVETALYRIVQEGLTNVARHAQVEQASVSLWADQSFVHLTLEDAGVGFSPSPEAALGNPSLGLSGIEERVAALKGQVEVESAPGEGTRLRVDLPLEIFP